MIFTDISLHILLYIEKQSDDWTELHKAELKSMGINSLPSLQSLNPELLDSVVNCFEETYTQKHTLKKALEEAVDGEWPEEYQVTVMGPIMR